MIIDARGARGFGPQRIIADGHTPRWSPDGSRLAFAALDAPTIVIHARDGRRERELDVRGEDQGIGLDGFGWLANGRGLVYSIHELTPALGKTGNRLHRIDLDGTNARLLTTRDADKHPDVQPLP